MNYDLYGLAAAYDLDAHLARQCGRFDDAQLCEEAALSTRAGNWQLFRLSTFRGLPSNSFRSESVTPRGAQCSSPDLGETVVTDSLGHESD